MKEFTQKAIEELGNYVYRLVDPRNAETFYVGKGTKNRVFAHVSNELRLRDDEDDLSAKLQTIKEIRSEGLEVIHIIHRHGIPDEAVIEVEAALIDCYPGLSNIQAGHYSNDRGPMHTSQIAKKYDLPKLEVDPNHKLLLINVNNISDRSSKEAIYEQTKCSWRISVSKAEQADFILSVYRGVVIGAFVADKWVKSVPKYFGDRAVKGRYGFLGTAAPDDVWDYYVGEHGKLIEDNALNHVQNPIRYWNI